MAEPSTTTNPSASRFPPPLRSNTSQSRIDDILDTARRRSIALGDPAHREPIMLSPQQSMRISEVEAHAGDGPESSADDQTPIVRRESSKRGDYQSTGSSLRNRNSEAAARRPGPDRRTHPAQPDTEPEQEQSWWKKQVEKYGSIELENKGSVARDHLALGTSLFLYHYFKICPVPRLRSLHRTYIFSMAPNLSCVCLYRYSCHTTLPSKYHYVKQP
jgi:hypothetical protein